MVLNKYLGWVLRFFFHVESGQLPPIICTLPIDQDWPLNVEMPTTIPYTTIDGSVTTTIVSTNSEEHALVTIAEAHRSAAGTFDVGDSFQLTKFVEGNSIPLITIPVSVTLWDHIPLINSLSIVALSATARINMMGLPPVYLPPNSSLKWTHTSTAAGAGLVAGLLFEAIRRPRSYPLRLP